MGSYAGRFLKPLQLQTANPNERLLDALLREDYPTLAAPEHSTAALIQHLNISLTQQHSMAPLFFGGDD
jgi:hypothetical protein